MGRFTRSNEKEEENPEFEQQKASAFAKAVLGRVGGSLVYIGGKKRADKFIEEKTL